MFPAKNTSPAEPLGTFPQASGSSGRGGFHLQPLQKQRLPPASPPRADAGAQDGGEEHAWSVETKELLAQTERRSHLGGNAEAGQAGSAVDESDGDRLSPELREGITVDESDGDPLSPELREGKSWPGSRLGQFVHERARIHTHTHIRVYRNTHTHTHTHTHTQSRRASFRTSCRRLLDYRLMKSSSGVCVYVSMCGWVGGCGHTDMHLLTNDNPRKCTCNSDTGVHMLYDLASAQVRGGAAGTRGGELRG